MTLPVRKGYKGAPAQAVLTNSPTSSDTSFVVDTVVGWATAFPFYCVVDPGKSTEEKVKVTAISGSTLTVVRAQDDTSASGHSSGVSIYPVFTADEADEANQIASAMTTKGDLIATDGSSINRLGVGTNTHVLQADSTVTNGFKWGQIVEAGIADSAVTNAKLGANAVTSAKILDNTIVLGDLATALQAFLVPVGSISAYAGLTAPTGWLLCNGTSTSGYTALAALVGATTPNLAGRTIVGVGTGVGLTARALNASGGAETHALTIAELAVHAHTSAAHTHAYTVASFSTINSGSGLGINHTHGGVVTGSDNTYGNNESTDHQHSYIAGSSSSTSTGGASDSTMTSTGSGSAHENMQPFYVLSYIIKHD